jgi:isocitrate dehydrogenase
VEPARVLGQALDEATTRYLLENRSPSRKVRELDNRGSHFYLAMYWAQALVAQTADGDVAEAFGPIASQLADHAQTIIDELNAAQGPACDVGGYFRPDVDKVVAAMRPSGTLNAIIDGI